MWVIWVLCNMYRKQTIEVSFRVSLWNDTVQHPWLQLLNEWTSLISYMMLRKTEKKGLPTLPILGDYRNNRFHLHPSDATGRCALQSLQVAGRSWHGWRCWETLATWLETEGMWDVGWNGSNKIFPFNLIYIYIYMIYFDESTTV